MSTTMQLAWPSFNVNVAQISVYLKQTLSSNYDGIFATSENMTVVFKTDVSDSDSALTNTYWSSITAQTFQPTEQQILIQKVQAAQLFGQQMLLQIEVDNLLAGLTTAQVSQMLSDYSTLISMLSTGSLVTALAAAQNLVPMDGMTQDRINSYVAKIQAFLTQG